MQGESEKDMTIKSFEKKGFIINKPFEVYKFTTSGCRTGQTILLHGKMPGMGKGI